MFNDKMNGNANEIADLLKDICDYLKKTKGNKELTDEERKIAEVLIDRSRKQLQKIAALNGNDNEYIDVDSKPNQSKPDANGHPEKDIERYVDMSRQSTYDVAPPLPEKPVIPPKPLELTNQCPYKEFPAKQVSNETKHGTLLIRRKVFNIIDRLSKAYGAVHENWLLIYWSSRDSKPFCALDLKQYEAKEDESCLNIAELQIIKEGSFRKNNVKMTASFTVFQAGSPDKKSYNLVATTHKDMLQWVVNINRTHDKAVRGDKESDYEICEKPPPDMEEENIYSEIGMESNKIPPPVIVERPSEASPSPATLSESTEEIYQQIRSDNNRSMESLDSFTNSEPEEDATYYQLSTVRNEVAELRLNEPRDADDVPPPLPPPITEPVNMPNSQPLDNKYEPPKEKPKLPAKSSNKSVLKASREPTTSDTNKKSPQILSKPSQTSSIVKINRQNERFSIIEPQSPNMETFSNRSKLETFQASPTKEGHAMDLNFVATLSEEIASALKPIASVESKPGQKSNDNEKPMVLLKDGLNEEKSSKKSKKSSPLVFPKPKKSISNTKLHL